MSGLFVRSNYTTKPDEVLDPSAPGGRRTVGVTIYLNGARVGSASLGCEGGWIAEDMRTRNAELIQQQELLVDSEDPTDIPAEEQEPEQPRPTSAFKLK